MTADYNGYNDMRESEREGLSEWEDSDDLETDDVAPWRGPNASVHPAESGYPGKDADLEKEGEGHGDEDGS